ncbi:MAG: Mini-ribonuclease 3 [Christensenellaceae bacterium]|nr:Mini-ribonuclease 3 [Christensenellaceae bacterium]
MTIEKDGFKVFDGGAKNAFHSKLQYPASDFSPLTLAFLGDAVWSHLIKGVLVSENPTVAVGKLHQMATEVENARAQSFFMEIIKDALTPEEKELARMARNAFTNNVPKSAKLSEYKRATAFEAILGYHELCDNSERICEIASMVFDVICDDGDGDGGTDKE